MKQIILDIVNQFGYIGVFLLIAVENIFPPIHSEIILTFSGFMTTFTTMTIPGVVFFSTIGSVVGALVLYGVGRIFNAQRLEQWLDGKLGKLLGFKKEDVRKAEEWFLKRGTYTIFFCRFIPIVRSLISIPAGIAKMNLGVFLVLTTIGTAIWNAVLVYLGAVAGNSWETIAGYIDQYASVVLVVLIVVAAALCIWFIWDRFAKKR